MAEKTILEIVFTLIILIMTVTASALALWKAYDRGELCGPVVLAIIVLWVFEMFSLGYILKAIEKKSTADTTIETILNQNYYGYTNHHDDNQDKSFVYNGKKYNIDYDDTTNTLVIFEADGVSVDATYVNGQKQVINENN